MHALLNGARSALMIRAFHVFLHDRRRAAPEPIVVGLPDENGAAGRNAPAGQAVFERD